MANTVIKYFFQRLPFKEFFKKYQNFDGIPSAAMKFHFGDANFDKLYNKYNPISHSLDILA